VADLLPPPPPPADIIVEKLELEPLLVEETEPGCAEPGAADPPDPTVIGKAVAVTVIAPAPSKGDAV
jgi:hypothetical protein